MSASLYLPITSNGDKFECIKVGDNEDLKLMYNYITPGQDNSIGNVDNLRDLGVIVSTDGDYREHIYRIVSKAEQRAGWISRSFIRNSIKF